MRDPFILLALATFLALGALLVPQRRMNWALWARAAWSILIFIGITLILHQLANSPFRPEFHDIGPGQRFWEKLLVAFWWLLGARGIIGLIRFTVVLEKRPRETQILTDLIAGAIYIATTLAIVNFVFAVPIGGLVATSGIIAIVLGLALQSTLSDVFSGIAVGVERPYRAGDLIWVEGGIEGRVTLVTWRSTHIAVDHNNIAIVPNSVIAKARLINRSRPSSIRGEMVELRLDPAIPPERCIAMLEAALGSASHLLLKTPKPVILCSELCGDGNIYQVTFYVADSGDLDTARSALLAEIHRHLRHNGVGLALRSSANIIHIPEANLMNFLEHSDLFRVMDKTQLERLAPHFKEIFLEAGEILIRQGQQAEALFIITSGKVKITVEEGGVTRLIKHIGPGDGLGAIGFLAGEPYAATATAMTGLCAYRLERAVLAEAVKVEPRLTACLETLAEQGQAALRQDAAGHAADKNAEPDIFVDRLRNFIRLLKSHESP